MKICILGSSWGCGEWRDRPPIYVTHRGLEHYFQEIGATVLNFSEPGASNEFSLRKLTTALETHSFDYIFWFQSVPLTSLRPYTYFNKEKITYADLVFENTRLANEAYSNFNSLEIPIYCIGGGSILIMDKIVKYKNLYPIIPSITKLIYPDYIDPLIWQFEWSRYINQQFDLESLDLLLEDKKKQDQLFEFKDYFWPDGRHPNRYGYKIVFDFIVNKLGLK